MLYLDLCSIHLVTSIGIYKSKELTFGASPSLIPECLKLLSSVHLGLCCDREPIMKEVQLVMIASMIFVKDGFLLSAKYCILHFTIVFSTIVAL
uniref:Uncharacterized protein n=1 Tax=Populus trichocarpa TaxID=3694 RepID=A0A2K2A5K0_POPTR